MRVRILCATLMLGACAAQIGPDEKSGNEAAVGQSGRAFDADLQTFADGPLPWLGTSNLVVQGGALTLNATAGLGQGIVPYSIKPRTSAGEGFDSTITIEAEIPNGAQLIVGRGRLRDNYNQSGIGVVVAPSASAGNPTSFLVALGTGSVKGAAGPLACAGTPIGRSTLQIPTIAGTSTVTGITSPELGRQTISLPEAPQLALLSNNLFGGSGSATLETTRQSLTFKFQKKGNGIGAVGARQGDTDVIATTSLDATTMEGRSLACKLSWFTCEAICSSPLNALFVFGKACAPDACRDGVVTQDDATINPEPGDFSSTETCRQDVGCNIAPAPTSPVTQTAQAAIRETFRDDAASNEILLQLVRGRSGLAPRITRITVDR